MSTNFSKPHNIDDSALQQAYDYVSSLPNDQDILVWPSRLRAYNIATEDPRLTDLVNRYNSDREGIIQEFKNSFISDLVIVHHEIDSSAHDIELLLGATIMSRSPQEISEKFLASTQRCYGYIEDARNTWINSGYGFIKYAKSEPPDDEWLETCVFALLDFLNGFPTADRRFDPERFVASSEVRFAVMQAFFKCSQDRARTDKDAQVTRDGIAPFPSRQCALDYLSAPPAAEN